MRNEKKEAIKRTRKPKNKNSNLPLIIGLSIGIVILLILLVCIYIFVIREEKPIESQLTEMATTETNSNNLISETDLTENDSTSENTETVNEQDSNITNQIETESENEEVNKRLNEMSKEQKIDQLFILKPIALVNSAMENGEEKVDKVNQVGNLTQKAFSQMQIGGVLISENNTDDVDGSVQKFLLDLENEADKNYQMHLFMSVTQEDRGLFEESGLEGVATEEGYVEPDFVLNNLEVNALNGIELNVKYLAENADVEQIISALNDEFDMVIIADENFDYLSIRTKIAEQFPEEKLNEKVSKIISEKFRLKSQDTQQMTSEVQREVNEPTQESTELETETVLNHDVNEKIEVEKETAEIQTITNAEAVTNE